MQRLTAHEGSKFADVRLVRRQADEMTRVCRVAYRAGATIAERSSTMAEAATMEFSAEITSLADRLVGLSVKDAQSLVNCLKTVHGIEPAGGGVMMAAPAGGGGGGAATAEEKSTFNVILAGFGDKKIQVIKAVRAITSLGLKEAKDLVEGVPKPLKEGVTKEEADKIKKEIEESGGAVKIE
jgi:large subunit ribosomal protein L7/L12